MPATNPKETSTPNLPLRRKTIVEEPEELLIANLADIGVSLTVGWMRRADENNNKIKVLLIPVIPKSPCIF